MAVVTAMYNVAPFVPALFASLEHQLAAGGGVEVVLVDDGSTDATRHLAEAWAAKHAGRVRLITQTNAGQAAARNRALTEIDAPWVTFIDADDWVSAGYFAEVGDAIAAHPEAALIVANKVLAYDRDGSVRDHPLAWMYDRRRRVVDLDRQPNYIQGSAPSMFFRVEEIRRGALRFDPQIRPTFEDAEFVSRYLLGAPSRTAVYVRDAKYYYRKRVDDSSTLGSSLLDPRRYTDVPRLAHLALLTAHGGDRCPRWLANLIIYDLSWNFEAEDHGDQTRTAAVGEVGAAFVATFREICAHLDRETLAAYRVSELRPEWHAAFASAAGARPLLDTVRTDRLDRRLGLRRVRYLYSGDRPREAAIVDGRPVPPRWAKTRDVVYFDQVVGHERILWVDQRATALRRGDVDAPIRHSSWRRRAIRQVRPAAKQLASRPLVHRLAAATWNVTGRGVRRERWRDRVLGATAVGRTVRDGWGRAAAAPMTSMATSAAVPTPWRGLFGGRRRYAKAWLLIDRVTDANDSAEDLFRYLRAQRPDINAWFVVAANTADWHRLVADGYADRLVAHGSAAYARLRRHATEIITGHPDAALVGPLDGGGSTADRRVHFLNHGVIKDDLSRWLNALPLDTFVTSTVAEWHSIRDDHTGYVCGDREAVLSGMPRFDRLWQARQRAGRGDDRRRTLLVCPTWRTWTSQGAQRGRRRGPLADAAASDYAQRWAAVLEDADLREWAAAQGWERVMLPHPNTRELFAPLAEAAGWRVAEFSSAGLADEFVDAALAVTDYSSMAFNVAFLGGAVVYYQFDRDRVLEGGHLGRRGYFDYHRLGFGPVTTTHTELLDAVADVARRRGTPAEPYASRMADAFPIRDGQCCRRLVEAIEHVDQRPLPRPVPSPFSVRA